MYSYKLFLSISRKERMKKKSMGKVLPIQKKKIK